VVALCRVPVERAVQAPPSTLTGVSLLTFTADGLVATAHDYWFLEPGAHPPFAGWGR